jgi:multiple sugar transport system substrate-binding protein
MKKMFVIVSMVVLASMVLTACATATPTAAPAATATQPPAATATMAPTAMPPTPTVPAGKVLIRWSIGAGTGTNPAQIPIENDVVNDFNKSQNNIFLVDEIIPNASAPDTLATEMAAGAFPDIVGPVGFLGSNQFYGQWLDLTPYIKADNYDMTKFDPSLVKMMQSEAQGTIGLPFAVYPSAIYYNIGLFKEAGLNPPPVNYGDQYTFPDGTKADWTWDTVKKVAQLLTIDKNGKNSLDPAFDPTNVVQYGFTWQWENKASYWGSYFANGQYLVPGGTKGSYAAQLPDAWKAAWQWYYDGVWGKNPYIPSATVEASANFDSGNSFASGKVAMAEMPSWYTCCVGDLIKAKGTFDFGIMPSYNGQVSGRVDADSFRIWKDTKHPQEAWEVLKYITDIGIQKLVVGTTTTPPAYGAVPGQASMRQPWLASMNAAFPATKNWATLEAGLAYPDVPSSEAWMPNLNEAWNRTVTFANLLGTQSGLDLNAQEATFQTDLTTIFNK